MNIFLAILLLIAILILFLLFLALVTKGEYVIERDIVIDQPLQKVFDYIKLIKNQETYSYWVMQDPTNKITYKGIDGTVGFLGAWEGQKQAGKGEQEIVALVDGKSIAVEVRFEKPFKNTAQTIMTTAAIGENQTQVTWRMNGENKFPFTLFNLVIDGMLGKDMSKSLVNLKGILENNIKI